MPPSVLEKDPLAGRLGHLSHDQAAALAEFKQQLEAAGLYKPGSGSELSEIHGGGLQGASHTDATLLRFLRARKFDVAQSKLMFSDSEKWRQEFKVEALYEASRQPQTSKVDAIYPQYYHKIDKEGRPVYISQPGKLDLSKLNDNAAVEQLQLLVVEYEKFLRERLPNCSVQENRLVETSCTIMDLSGVGIQQFRKVKSHVQSASSVAQNYYPETMGKFYIINAPYFFTTVWYLVRPWLDEVTANKIVILDSNYKSALLAQIDAENLPKAFGGTCECPGGCSVSDEGPWRDDGAARKVQESVDANAASS